MTIENDKQLEAKQRHLGRLKRYLPYHLEPSEELSIIHKAQLEGMESIIKDLEKEIEDYTK